MTVTEAYSIGAAAARAGRKYPHGMAPSGWTWDQKSAYRDGWVLAAHEEILRLRKLVEDEDNAAISPGLRAPEKAGRPVRRIGEAGR